MNNLNPVLENLKQKTVQETPSNSFILRMILPSLIKVPRSFMEPKMNSFPTNP
jgi:hypothetical protein